MAMVAMGLGQFQRFLSCDLCIGLQTPLSGYCSGPDLMVTLGYRLATFSQDLPLSFSLPPPCSLYPKLPLGTFYFFLMGFPQNVLISFIMRADFCCILCCIFFSFLKKKKKVKLLNGAQLFVTPWTVACQASLFMGFSRQEYWRGLPFPWPILTQG